MGRPRELYADVEPEVEAAIVEARARGCTLARCARIGGYCVPVTRRVLARHPEVDPVLRRARWERR